MAQRGQREVSKKVKQGPMDVDFTESALVVTYDVETVSFVPYLYVFLCLLKGMTVLGGAG